MGYSKLSGCWLRAFAAGLLATLAFACSPPRVVQTALHGNLTDLEREIATAKARGELDADTTSALARAVASRIVVSSSNPQELFWLRTRPGCRDTLSDAIGLRAERGDAVAAEAVQGLFEAGQGDDEALLRRYSGSVDPSWRAVAARAALAPDRAQLRQQLSLDPDSRVRVAALLAARDAGTQEDLPALLEAGRLDPEPRARALALRSLGRQGTERVNLALRDFYDHAELRDRRAIVQAWSDPQLVVHGGANQLDHAALGLGLEATEAAAALAALPGSRGERGSALLVRQLHHGALPARLRAIELARIDHPGERAALVEVAASRPPQAVRVAALGKLLKWPGQRTRATQQLRALARRRNAAAIQARSLLALDLDATMVELLAKQLQTSSLEGRQAAAQGLVALGRFDLAAPFLAVADRSARLQFACAVLAADP